MDQFHHVSKAFLELGKKLVLIFAHLSGTYFDISWYMWFMTCCLFLKIYPLLFLLPEGKLGVSWVECKNLDIERVVVCCGCDNQIHASFKIFILYIDYWLQIDGSRWGFAFMIVYNYQLLPCYIILVSLLYIFSSDAIELQIPS